MMRDKAPLGAVDRDGQLPGDEWYRSEEGQMDGRDLKADGDGLREMTPNEIRVDELEALRGAAWGDPTEPGPTGYRVLQMIDYRIRLLRSLSDPEVDEQIEQIERISSLIADVGRSAAIATAVQMLILNETTNIIEPQQARRLAALVTDDLLKTIRDNAD